MKDQPQSANMSGFRSETAASPSESANPLNLTIRELSLEGSRVWQPGIGGEWHLVHIPKKAHFYWGNERTSFLRYMTLFSFRRWNPDWEIHLYRPSKMTKVDSTWETWESYEAGSYQGQDYSKDVFRVPGLFLHEVDFSSVPDISSAAETYKADLFRWFILAKVGGIFSDMDILFMRSMNEAMFNVPEHAHTQALICCQEDGHIIGFLGSAPGSPLFEDLANQATSAFNPQSYQAIGAHLLDRIAPSPQALKQRYPEMPFLNLPMALVYPYRWTEVDHIFEFQDERPYVEDTLGIHWFGGNPISQVFCERMDSEHWMQYPNAISQQLKRVLAEEVTPLPQPIIPPRPSQGPLFSIIVPAYNHAHFLPETLDSIQTQTCRDWEAILVNDGSTDETPQLLEAYARKDPRFKVVHKVNGGVSTALNEGLKHATGTYICWLSSDDLYEADALSAFSEAIRLHPEIKFFHSNYSVLWHERSIKQLMPDQRRSEIPAPEFQVIRFFHVNYVNGISICIHRDLFECSGTFDVRYRNAQDHDMWLRLSALTPFHFVDRRTCITRSHEAAETTAFPEAGLLDSARSCMEFLNRERFPALFPFLDLETLEGYSLAVQATLEVALDTKSWTYYGVGPVPALLERFSEWIQQVPPKPWETATLEALKSNLENISHLPSEIQSILQNLIDGVPIIYQPHDPLQAMDQWAQHLEILGKHQESGIIRRYLDRVIPHAHLPASAKPIPPGKPGRPMSHQIISCEAFIHEVDWSGSEWVEVLLAFLTAFQPSDPVRMVLHWDAGAEGGPDHNEGQHRVLELIAQTGRTRFPDVVLISIPAELAASIDDCRRVMEIPRERQFTGSISGIHGWKFLAARKALTNK